MKLLHTSALAIVLGATSGLAGDTTTGDLTVVEPFAFSTPATARAAGGFMTIKNTGTEADALIGIKADFPRVELHTTEEQDGVARMMHVDKIDVPAGETVELAPGGLHVMFMGLGGDPFEVDEEVPATLVFEKAGEVEVVFQVRERPKGGHGSQPATN